MFIVIRTSTNDLASDLIFNNNTMNRNKIERWILSEHHLKRPTLVFMLTLIISVSIVTSMLLYILNIHNK